jgi:hypothetical protein
VELPERLTAGTRLTITIDTEAGPIRMAGTVLWMGSPSRAGQRILHGLQFSSSSEDSSRLSAWLQCHQGSLARTAASLPARCRPLDGVGPALEGWTADLASSGCALFLPERLAVGALLEAMLSTPVGDVRCEGVVVWAGHAAARSGRLVEHGFRFTKMRADQETLLRGLLGGIHPPGAPGNRGS